jgi:hypothetical protein
MNVLLKMETDSLHKCSIEIVEGRILINGTDIGLQTKGTVEIMIKSNVIKVEPYNENIIKELNEISSETKN